MDDHFCYRCLYPLNGNYHRVAHERICAECYQKRLYTFVMCYLDEQQTIYAAATAHYIEPAVRMMGITGLVHISLDTDSGVYTVQFYMDTRHNNRVTYIVHRIPGIIY